MVERFNGRISDLIAQTRFSSAAEFQTTLKLYLATYNHSIPQRALHHRTPIQALKAWQEKKPELFVKRVPDWQGCSASRRVTLTLTPTLSHGYAGEGADLFTLPLPLAGEVPA